MVIAVLQHCLSSLAPYDVCCGLNRDSSDLDQAKDLGLSVMVWKASSFRQDDHPATYLGKFSAACPLLKGPKHEIFESGFFTQIRRLWLGDLGTGEKNYFKVFAANFLLSVRSACA